MASCCYPDADNSQQQSADAPPALVRRLLATAMAAAVSCQAVPALAVGNARLPPIDSGGMVLTATLTRHLLQTAECATPARLSNCAGFPVDPARCERAYVGNTLGMVSLCGRGHWTCWIARDMTALRFAFAAEHVTCSTARRMLPAGQCSVRQAAGPAQVCLCW